MTIEKASIDKKHIDNNLYGADRVFLKYTDKTVLGFILKQQFWNLSDLFVLPSAQGNGVGKQLFVEAKSVCEVSGGGFMCQILRHRTLSCRLYTNIKR